MQQYHRNSDECIITYYTHLSFISSYQRNGNQVINDNVFGRLDLNYQKYQPRIMHYSDIFGLPVRFYFINGQLYVYMLTLICSIECVYNNAFNSIDICLDDRALECYSTISFSIETLTSHQNIG